MKYAYLSCIGPVELHLADGRVIDQAHITKMLPGAMTAEKPKFRARLGGTIHEPPTPSAGAKASFVEFLVPQLKTQKGWPIRYGKGVRCARHKLTGGDWSITLDELKNCDDTWKELEKNSGYGATHVGRLRRVDNAPFNCQTTSHVLRGLGWYLSFACGRWTGPILTRGFDIAGGLLWDLWDSWRIVPCVERQTWITPHMTEQFEEPFAGFFKAWENPELTEVIEIAIHWHMEANAQAGSIEGAIVLIQTAFEMLASAMPVAKHADMSKKTFDNLAAWERTKRLFEWAGIPTTLPPQFKDLAAVVGDPKQKHAPGAMAAIRNTITHPTPTNRAKYTSHTNQARYEAWLIGLWYLELCILRVFGHHGAYLNRCTGKMEQVPWVLPSKKLGP